MKPSRLFSAIAAAALLFASCVKTPTEVAVTSVSVIPTSMELTVGDTHSISATVEPSDATNKGVTWKSSDTGIATVNDGKVTAVAPGNATITVTTTDGGKTATCAVKVNPKPVPVSSVSLNETELKLTTGDKATLKATVLPEDATDKSVSWSTSDDKIATVKDGEVEAIAPGKATITVTTNNGSKTATCEVTVEAPVVKVSSVTVSPEAVELVEGAKVKLTATVLPEDATDKSVSWSTSDEKVAKVKDGEVEAVAIGTANITVTTTDGGKTAVCKVTVKAKAVAVTGVKLDKTELTLRVDESATLTATVEPAGASNKNVSWSADPASVVKVSNEGKVTGVAKGTGTVTVTTEDGGFKASCKVTVSEGYVAVTGIKVTPDEINCQEEDEINLTAEVVPATATNKKVDFVIADESIITAAGSGDNLVSLKAVKAGTTKITVKAADGISKEVPVTVLPKPVIPPAVVLTVDLGLPSGNIWSTTNVGGTYPWDIGDYYAWGETVPKTTFTADTYKWGIEGALTKYCMSDADGKPDGRLRLLKEDDAAAANMGGDWRMPNSFEAKELIDNCTWKEVTIEGVKGFEGTGPNGQTIFFPNNGFMGKSLHYTDRPYIATSDLQFIQNPSSSCTQILRIGTNDSYVVGLYQFNRIANGLGIRGIIPAKTIAVTSVSLNKSSITIEATHRQQLIAHVSPENATDIFVKWSSSNNSIATVDAAGTITGVKAGTATITATTNDGAKKASCTVTVVEPVILPASINLSQTEIRMEPMRTAFVSVNVLPNNATDKTVTWTYSNDLVVVDNVDDKGVARINSFNSKGTCLITFKTVNGLTTSLKVIVGDAPKEPEAIDLGLPSGTLWASYNVGATKPQEPGTYYAWGDTDTKTEFTWASYYYYNSSLSPTIFKYNKDDNKKRLDYWDDQAWWIYGGEWRVPTVAMYQELKDNCTITVETYFGVYGAKFTGPNGMSIFLPFNGYMDGTSTVEKNSQCFYWLSDLDPSNIGSGCYFYVRRSDNASEAYVCGRNYGLPVRAVKPGNKQPKVANPSMGHEWVDLGLSVLWATSNVGTNSPYTSGHYFAWGETSPQSSNTYDWSSYKWCQGSENSMTKYNKDPNYGKVDNKTKLELTDDAARANWGGEWRMPTTSELNELYNNCTMSNTTMSGQPVTVFKSKINGKSITVARAGYMYQGSTSESEAYDSPFIWSSELNDNPFAIKLYSNGISGLKRRVGASVRPVITAPEQSLLKAISRKSSPDGRPTAGNPTPRKASGSVRTAPGNENQ